MNRLLVIFVLALLAFSCKKERDTSLKAPDDGTYFFLVTIDGYEKLHQKGRNGFVTYSRTEREEQDGIYYTSHTAGLYQEKLNYYVSVDEQLYLRFRNIDNPDPAVFKHDSIFHAIMGVGSKTYYQRINNTDTLIQKGVEVLFIDSHRKLWSTRFGEQSGSLFDITESTELSAIPGNHSHEVKATFNCILYSEADNSKSLPLTIGTMLINFTDSID
jgi:hypothetical protein